MSKVLFWSYTCITTRIHIWDETEIKMNNGELENITTFHLK